MSLLLSVVLALILLFSIVRASALHIEVLYDFVFLSAANVLVILMAFPLAQSQERNALTDFLTGLANRNRGYTALASEIERAKRYNEFFSIILFDLDHFKKVNDSFGHPTGDAVLREIAAFLSEQTRRTDLLCRWGGEEFLLLMTHADLASARLKAEHLRQQFTHRPFQQTIHLTASFGATTFYPNDSANSMLERADAALYRAKRNGRNTVQVD
jgi:diguanylate cyclase (GGDEF)-like protein